MDGGRNEYYKKLLTRAQSKGYDDDPMLLLQNIEYADTVFDLRLSELLHATAADFCHDIRCIMYYARKDKYPLTNYLSHLHLFSFFLSEFYLYLQKI